MPLCLGPLPGFCLECIVVSLLGGTLALLKSLRQIKHFSFGLLNLTYFQNSTFIMCAVHSQWCLTLCDPIGCSPCNSPGQNTGGGRLSLLQGIFATQGSNPGFPHCRQILYHLSYQGAHSLEKYLFKFLANLKIGVFGVFATRFCEFPIFFGFFTSWTTRETQEYWSG